jgi:hypothetical protein
MIIGKLYQVTVRTNKKKKNISQPILVTEQDNALFGKKLDMLEPGEIFVPLEECRTFIETKLQIVKVCTPRGIKGYATFFEGECEYQIVKE